MTNNKHFKFPRVHFYPPSLESLPSLRQLDESETVSSKRFILLKFSFFSLTASADKQLLFSYLYYDQRGPWRKDCEGNSFYTDVIWIKCRQREALPIFIGTSWPKPSNSETFWLDNSHSGLAHPSSSHGWAGWMQRMQSVTALTWGTQTLAQVKRQGSDCHHLTFGTWVLSFFKESYYHSC